MKEFVTPGVPELSDEWITARTQHLIDEVSAPSPRRTRRFVLTGVGGGAVAAAALVAGLLGPWATPAFAGWSSQPTTPSSDQLGAAQSSCAALAQNFATISNGTASATLPPISLSDARGPYTLILYGASSPALCVSGNGFTSLQENGASIGTASSGASANSQFGSNVFTSNRRVDDAVPPPSGAVVNLAYTASGGGQSFSVAVGAVGSQVTEATLQLSDGSSVVTTVSSGLFAAWWPGQATVSSIQVTTTAGVN